MSCAGSRREGTAPHGSPAPAASCRHLLAGRSCTARLRGQVGWAFPPHSPEPCHCGFRHPQRCWLCLLLWSLVEGAARRAVNSRVGCPKKGARPEGGQSSWLRDPPFCDLLLVKNSCSRAGLAPSLAAGVEECQGRGTTVCRGQGGGWQGGMGAGRGWGGGWGADGQEAWGVDECAAGGASLCPLNVCYAVSRLCRNTVQVYSFLLAEQPMAVHTVTSPLRLRLSFHVERPLIPSTAGRLITIVSPFGSQLQQDPPLGLGGPADLARPLCRGPRSPHALSWPVCRCLAVLCLFGRKVACRERET